MSAAVPGLRASGTLACAEAATWAVGSAISDGGGVYLRGSRDAGPCPLASAGWVVARAGTLGRRHAGPGERGGAAHLSGAGARPPGTRRCAARRVVHRARRAAPARAARQCGGRVPLAAARAARALAASGGPPGAAGLAPGPAGQPRRRLPWLAPDQQRVSLLLRTPDLPGRAAPR